MAEPGDEPERIIAVAIERHGKGDPAALAREIVVELRNAGFEIRANPDMIPIKGTPP